MADLLQRIAQIEITLDTETDKFKRWCQRETLRKLLNRLDRMAKRA